MQAYLNEDPKQWIVMDEVGSTNTFLLENNFASGTVCLAHHQSAGRGRRNRKWISSQGCSFLFSGLLCLKHDMEQLKYLALLTGASVMAALKSCLERHKQVFTSEMKKDLEFSFKWPNDIYLKSNRESMAWPKSGKLCGILIESQVIHSIKRIVLGIGLNWCEDKEQRKAPFVNPQVHSGIVPSFLFPTSLELHMKKCPDLASPLSFTPYLLRALNERLEQWQGKNYSFLQELREHFYLDDRFLLYKGQVYKVRGLSEDSALMIEEIEKGHCKVLYSSEEEFELLT